MTAKDYLRQAYRIDHRINSKLEQVSSLRELAIKTTSVLTDMPRKPNRNAHPTEIIIAKMIDLEDEINNDIDMLVDLKREIVELIKSVENTEHQTLLELRYLCFKSWEQIAVDMRYEIRYLHKLHGKALESCDVILKRTLKDI